MTDPAAVVKFVAALGCGLMGGVFFAFSTFVMKALGRLPAHEGIAAMQAINLYAVQSWFIGGFLGTTLACLYLGVSSFWHLDEGGTHYLIAGSALYLIGGFLITLAGNVPMNNLLAGLNPTDPAAATYWAEYLTRWTLWNHVRTGSCILATASLLRGIV